MLQLIDVQTFYGTSQVLFDLSMVVGTGDSSSAVTVSRTASIVRPA